LRVCGNPSKLHCGHVPSAPTPWGAKCCPLPQRRRHERSSRVCTMSCGRACASATPHCGRLFGVHQIGVLGCRPPSSPPCQQTCLQARWRLPVEPRAKSAMCKFPWRSRSKCPPRQAPISQRVGASAVLMGLALGEGMGALSEVEVEVGGGAQGAEAAASSYRPNTSQAGLGLDFSPNLQVAFIHPATNQSKAMMSLPHVSSSAVSSAAATGLWELAGCVARAGAVLSHANKSTSELSTSC
jgi:hypothetical protein